MKFSTITSWMKSTMPEMAQRLQPPATLEELQGLEDRTGWQLPDDYIELYLAHNGQDESSIGGIFFDLDFMPIQTVRSFWEIYAEDSNLVRELGHSHTPHAIKPYCYRPGWIPFAHSWSNNYIGIDLEPDTSGSKGQVINFGNDQEEKFVLAASIPLFLEWYYKQLTTKNYKLEQLTTENGRTETVLQLNRSGSFFDELPALFG